MVFCFAFYVIEVIVKIIAYSYAPVHFCISVCFSCMLMMCARVVFRPSKYWYFSHYFLDSDEHEVGYGVSNRTQKKRARKAGKEGGAAGVAAARRSALPQGAVTKTGMIRRFSQVMQSIPVPSQLKALHAKAKKESLMQTFEHRFEAVLVLGSLVMLILLLGSTGFTYLDRIRYPFPFLASVTGLPFMTLVWFAICVARS